MARRGSLGEPQELQTKGRRRVAPAHWRPVGLSFVDRYDLPVEEHYARARAIVDAGSAFAIVSDTERGELRIFRASGVETSTEALRLLEWRWFEIYVGTVAGER